MEQGAKIERGYVCLTCGYALRGLNESGTCPECGKPVQDSLRIALLEESEARHVRRLALGAALAFWPAVAIVLMWIGLIAAEVERLELGAWEYAVVLPVAGFVAGWWLLTTAEPGRADERPSLRVLVRTSLIVSVVTGVLNAAAEGSVAWWNEIASLIADAVLLAALGVCVWAGMRHVRRLASRSAFLYKWSVRLSRLGAGWILVALLQLTMELLYDRWLRSQPEAVTQSLALEPMSLAAAGMTTITVLYTLAMLSLYMAVTGVLWRQLRRVKPRAA